MIRGLPVLLLILAGTLHAGDTTPPHFRLQATWYETLLASREALARQEAEAEQRLADQKAADAVLKHFRASDWEVQGQAEPRLVKVRVAGLKKIYLGAGGSQEVAFGDPQLRARGGEVTALHIGKARTLGRHGWHQHDEHNGWQPLKLGGRVFEHGFRMRDTELALDLDGQSESLEVWVGSTAANSRTPCWVDEHSRSERVEAADKARESLWRLVGQHFSQASAVNEQRLEAADGIWQRDWATDDLADLAQRYAAACSSFKERAKEWAAAVKTPEDLRRVRNVYYFAHLGPYLDLAQRTLEFVERSAPRLQFANQLQQLQRQAADVHQGEQRGEALYTQVCELRRKLIFSHPLLDFERLLINKRSGHLPEHMCDQYLGRHSRAAPGLVALTSWKDRPQATELLAGKLPTGATLHPDLSYDGKRVVFAFADHADARNGTLRGYHIYELSLEKGEVRQVTGTASDPLQGLYGRETVLIEDFDPCYLPDGGLAFLSTRSQQFGRCHGGRYVPAYTLYRAELDGSHIRPLSFNESNEWGPSVLHDGLLVYTRWDYVNRHDTIFQSLWVMQPDGTATAHYYGNNSPAPCLIGETRAIPGSRKVVATAAAHHGQTLGTLIMIDPELGQDHGAPLTWLTPELSFPESGVPRDLTATPKPLPEQTAAATRDRPARAATPYALSEDLFLAGYQHGDEYAVYLIDTLGGRELIYADPEISCLDPIPLRPTPQPPTIASTIVGKEQTPTGQFFIQDVYQCRHPLEPGSIRAIRVNELISQPTSSAPVRSQVANELVKRVLGTVPVNADGSVAFEAPAGKLLQLQLLDEQGLAVMTMRSSVYLQPGEQASCVGCHESRYESPVKATRVRPTKIQTLKPPAGPQYAGGFSYVRTVQPVLDRYCIGCHGLEKTEGGISLLGTKGESDSQAHNDRQAFTVSYASLVKGHALVKLAPRNGESYPSKPKDYFAHAGRLASLLLDGHPDKQGQKRVELDRDSFQRVANWLDVNGQFYGDYSFNRVEDQQASADGEQALRQAIEQRFGSAWAKQPWAALVNAACPSESRVLKAPLAEKAGGWGQVTQNGWLGTNDPSYREMLRLVEASITPVPCHDLAGTCGREQGCRCGVCWARRDQETRRKQAETDSPIATTHVGQ
jgi:hypothetical protein